jgi:pyridoxal phosphate enzyme (YggS family)
MKINQFLHTIIQDLPSEVSLVAVSKTKSTPMLIEAYEAGHRDFGENKVQEMIEKFDALPKDIQWHMIGHLQRNKVKYIAQFVSLIQTVDSMKLLIEINKRAAQNNRIINCLLQIDIAREKTKFGLTKSDAIEILTLSEKMENIRIIGLMGMATNSQDVSVVKKEFFGLSNFYKKLKLKYQHFEILSMGMSGDFKIAIEQGSNMVRLGSAIFGSR